MRQIESLKLVSIMLTTGATLRATLAQFSRLIVEKLETGDRSLAVLNTRDKTRETDLRRPRIPGSIPSLEFTLNRFSPLPFVANHATRR